MNFFDLVGRWTGELGERLVAASFRFNLPLSLTVQAALGGLWDHALYTLKSQNFVTLGLSVDVYLRDYETANNMTLEYRKSLKCWDVEISILQGSEGQTE